MTFMYLKYCDLICFKYLQLVAQSQATTNIRENFRKQHNNISYTASAT